MSEAQDRDYQPQPKVQEVPARVGTGFDLRVNIKDGKTGEMIKTQPYNRHCVGTKTYYERPIGSGNLFWESGEAAGRWVRNPDFKKGTGNVEFMPDEAAAHIFYDEEKTVKFSQEAANEVLAENTALKAELDALKAEKEAKMSADKHALTTLKGQFEQKRP
jgi:hypothetical protein